MLLLLRQNDAVACFGSAYAVRQKFVVVEDVDYDADAVVDAVAVSGVLDGGRLVVEVDAAAVVLLLLLLVDVAAAVVVRGVASDVVVFVVVLVVAAVFV